MSTELRLHAEHEALGATFSSSEDEEVVLRYRDVQAEVEALETSVGIADLSARAVLQVMGPEAALFLHGMVTNDVNGLKPGEGNYTTVIHARGRMLGEGRVLVREGGQIFLDVAPGAKDAVAAHLDDYLISEDCEVADLSGALAIFGAWGPKAGALIEGVLGEPAPDLPLHHHRSYAIGGGELMVIASAPAGVEGYELLCTADGAKIVWERLVEVAAALEGGPVGREALDAMRIVHGIPAWGKELGEKTIPLEANLQEAIDYTKGCYVGQEVIAKATYRGAVRQRLCRLEVSAGAQEGATLLEGDKRAGTLTSVLDPNPRGGASLALGYVRRDRLEAGRELTIEGGGSAKIVWAPKEEKR